MKLPPLPANWYLESEVRDYGLACAEAMREECAKKAEEENCDQTEYRCDTVTRCASAIRSIEVER